MVWRVGVHGLKLSNLVWCGVITCGVGSGCIKAIRYCVVLNEFTEAVDSYLML